MTGLCDEPDRIFHDLNPPIDTCCVAQKRRSTDIQTGMQADDQRSPQSVRLSPDLISSVLEILNGISFYLNCSFQKSSRAGETKTRKGKNALVK